MMAYEYSLQKFTAWSYSRWASYEPSIGGCPLAAKLKHLDKLKEPTNAAMERGAKIHKEGEDFLKGPVDAPMPGTYALVSDQMKYLKANGAKAESEWAFTNAWMSTSWFGRDAWCRIKVDAELPLGDHLDIIDHKTGRENESHLMQLDLYVIGGFLKYPNIKYITPRLLYLDTGRDVPSEKTYKRSQLKSLQKQWEERVRPMMNDTRFAPNPTNKCRWCHFRKDNGGPCKY